MKENIVVFTGPSLNSNKAEKILKAEYRPPIKRGDITTVLNQGVDIIGIIDGVFHQEPAVSHREILDALKKGVIVVGGASMGALRASELDDLGMIGVGYVYKQYKSGAIESDDDVAVVFNPDNMQQLSESLISIKYNLEMAVKHGIITKDEFSGILRLLKSAYYPKRNYNIIFNSNILDKTSSKDLKRFLDENKVDVKTRDAIEVLNYIKNLINSLD
ncbi:MAG: TfuA-related McrA-glycine thioamidation protein [Methanobacteriaceae archaeon]|nr:TfuA-related McrA-glycine thioamidation protein [Methanobacteriaceae archaeon]